MKNNLKLMVCFLIVGTLSVFVSGVPTPASAAEKGAAKAEKLFNPYSKKAGESYIKLGAAKKGGVIYSRLAGNPRVLNPMQTGDVESTNVIAYLYAPLMDMDPESAEFFPCLAEKFEASKDFKTLVFTLRKDAVWEDGSPITADDAEFTYKILMDPKTDAAPKRAYYEGIKFEKLDQYSFKFLVDKPTINTLPTIVGDFLLIQKKQFVNEKDFNKSKGIFAPVGSGPYKLKSYSRDQKVELERNKEWWGNKVPQYKNLNNFDSIVFRIIPDTALAYEKFIKGEIDVIEMNAEMYGTRVKGSDKDKFGTAAGSDKEVWAAVHRTSAPASMTYIGWNLQRSYFKSKKTRQALAQLIDYDQIIEKVYQGVQVRSASPFGTLTQNTSPEQRTKAFKFNPAKALAALKADGWNDTDGDGVLDKMIDGKKVKFEFTLRYNSENPMRAKVAQMTKENFKKAGIVVNVQAMEWNAHINEIDNRNFDAIVMGWGKGFINPDIKQIWHSKSYADKGSNFGGYNNPEIDKLIEKADAELNPQKRSKIVQQAGSIIYDDQPYVFLSEMPGYIAGYHRKLKASKWFMKYSDSPAIPLFSAQ